MEETMMVGTAVEAAAVTGAKAGIGLATIGFGLAGVAVGGYVLYKAGQKVVSMYHENEAKKDAALEERIRKIVDVSMSDMEVRITDKVSKAAADAAATAVTAALSGLFAAPAPVAAPEVVAVAPVVVAPAAPAESVA